MSRTKLIGVDQVFFSKGIGASGDGGVGGSKRRRGRKWVKVNRILGVARTIFGDDSIQNSRI